MDRRGESYIPNIPDKGPLFEGIDDMHPIDVGRSEELDKQRDRLTELRKASETQREGSSQSSFDFGGGIDISDGYGVKRDKSGDVIN